MLVRHNGEFVFEGLDEENLDVDILAGMPFMEYNDGVQPAKHQVTLSDGTIYKSESVERPYHQHNIRHAHIL